MKVFQYAALVAVLASLSLAESITLSEPSDAFTPIELDLLTDSFADVKKYKTTKKADLLPAVNGISAEARLVKDEDEGNHLVLKLTQQWDIEWSPTVNNAKTPEYAAVSWSVIPASEILMDEETGEKVIPEDLLREVAVQGVVQDPTTKESLYTAHQETVADGSVEVDYSSQGVAYLGSAGVGEALLNSWTSFNTSFISTEIKGKQYLQAMQFSTQRAFEVGNEFDLDANEEYLLCVDSWVNNGTIVRTNRGCGMFTIDLPVVEVPDEQCEGEDCVKDGEGNPDKGTEPDSA